MGFVIVLVAIVSLVAVGSWARTRWESARFDAMTPDLHKTAAEVELNVQTHRSGVPGPPMW